MHGRVFGEKLFDLRELFAQVLILGDGFFLFFDEVFELLLAGDFQLCTSVEVHRVLGVEKPVISEAFGDGGGVVVVERACLEIAGLGEELVVLLHVIFDYGFKVLCVQHAEDLLVKERVVSDGRKRGIILREELTFDAQERFVELVIAFGKRRGEVAYSYVVAGHTYAGLHEKPFISPNSAQDYTRRFVSGASLIVRVKPEAPETSVVRDEDQRGLSTEPPTRATQN